MEYYLRQIEVKNVDKSECFTLRLAGEQIIVGWSTVQSLSRYPSVSRRHATFVQESDGWYIRDTSVNGTYVNWVRIGNAAQKLEIGDHIGFGVRTPLEGFVCVFLLRIGTDIQSNIISTNLFSENLLCNSQAEKRNSALAVSNANLKQFFVSQVYESCIAKFERGETSSDNKTLITYENMYQTTIPSKIGSVKVKQNCVPSAHCASSMPGNPLPVNPPLNHNNPSFIDTSHKSNHKDEGTKECVLSDTSFEEVEILCVKIKCNSSDRLFTNDKIGGSNSFIKKPCVSANASTLSNLMLNNESVIVYSKVEEIDLVSDDETNQKEHDDNDILKMVSRKTDSTQEKCNEKDIQSETSTAQAVVKEPEKGIYNIDAIKNNPGYLDINNLHILSNDSTNESHQQRQLSLETSTNLKQKTNCHTNISCSPVDDETITESTYSKSEKSHILENVSLEKVNIRNSETDVPSTKRICLHDENTINLVVMCKENKARAGKEPKKDKTSGKRKIVQKTSFETLIEKHRRKRHKNKNSFGNWVPTKCTDLEVNNSFPSESKQLNIETENKSSNTSFENSSCMTRIPCSKSVPSDSFKAEASENTSFQSVMKTHSIVQTEFEKSSVKETVIENSDCDTINNNVLSQSSSLIEVANDLNKDQNTVAVKSLQVISNNKSDKTYPLTPKSKPIVPDKTVLSNKNQNTSAVKSLQVISNNDSQLNSKSEKTYPLTQKSKPIVSDKTALSSNKNHNTTSAIKSLQVISNNDCQLNSKSENTNPVTPKSKPIVPDKTVLSSNKNENTSAVNSLQVISNTDSQLNNKPEKTNILTPKSKPVVPDKTALSSKTNQNTSAVKTSQVVFDNNSQLINKREKAKASTPKSGSIAPEKTKLSSRQTTQTTKNGCIMKIDFYIMVRKVVELHWEWLVEQRHLSRPPPAISMGMKNLPLCFHSVNHYINSFTPILFMEIWDHMVKSFEESSKLQNVFCFTILSSRTVLGMTKYKCLSVVNQRSFPPKEGYLVTLDVPHTTREHSVQNTRMFGYISDLKIQDIHSGLGEEWRRLGEDCLYDAQMYKFFVFVKKTHVAPILKCVQRGCGISFIKEKLHLAEMLQQFPSSPLCTYVLFPKKDIFHFGEVSVFCKKNSDSSQETHVKKLKTEVLDSEHPRIALLHANPSKTSIILGLLLEMKHSFPSEKVLITAPTSAALEIIARLLQKDGGIRFVTIGTPCHSSSHPFYLDELAYNKCRKDTISMRKQTQKRPWKKFRRPALGEQQHIDPEVIFNKQLYKIKRSMLSECDVVLATLNNCGQPLLMSVFGPNAEKSFSCCFVDEASLCTELEILQVLPYGIKKLILFGIHGQQPFIPKMLVRYKYGRSMFERFHTFFKNIHT